MSSLAAAKTATQISALAAAKTATQIACSVQFGPSHENKFQDAHVKLSQERTLTERVSYFLFVLMSVSGGVHGDFPKPFRKSSAPCGVPFKCLV